MKKLLKNVGKDSIKSKLYVRQKFPLTNLNLSQLIKFEIFFQNVLICLITAMIHDKTCPYWSFLNYFVHIWTQKNQGRFLPFEQI